MKSASKTTAPTRREMSLNFLKFFSDASCVRFIKYTKHGTKQMSAIRYHERNGVKDKLRSAYIIGKLIVINSKMVANLREVFLPYFTANVLIFAKASAS
jgi:hypothetical protein